jgi:hypothetical protein
VSLGMAPAGEVADRAARRGRTGELADLLLAGVPLRLTREDPYALARNPRAEHGVDGVESLGMRGVRTAQSSHGSSFVVE